MGLIRFMDTIFATDETRRARLEPDSLFWSQIIDINTPEAQSLELHRPLRQPLLKHSLQGLHILQI